MTWPEASPAGVIPEWGTAFEVQIRARFEAASEQASSWQYRRWSEVLRAIYREQRDFLAYVALAEQTGLKPEDCLAVAKLLGERNPDEALDWVERGRTLDRETPMVVRNEVLNVSIQTALVKYDHMIQALAANGPDQAFNTVVAAESNGPTLDAFRPTRP